MSIALLQTSQLEETDTAGRPCRGASEEFSYPSTNYTKPNFEARSVAELSGARRTKAFFPTIVIAVFTVATFTSYKVSTALLIFDFEAFPSTRKHSLFCLS